MRACMGVEDPSELWFNMNEEQQKIEEEVKKTEGDQNEEANEMDEN